MDIKCYFTYWDFLFNLYGLSYVIDIYKDRIKVEKDFADYGYFVSPPPSLLLLAGHVDRAMHLLAQIKKHRTLGIIDE